MKNTFRLLNTTLGVSMHRIFVFRGHFYGMSRDGSIYSGTTHDTRITWRRSDMFPEGLIHLSITNDGKYLWLQRKERGFLFGKTGMVNEVRTQLLRNYTNVSSYVELDTKRNLVIYRDRSYQGYTDATLGYRNEVYVCREGRIVLLGWIPYFVESASLKVM